MPGHRSPSSFVYLCCWQASHTYSLCTHISQGYDITQLNICGRCVCRDNSVVMETQPARRSDQIKTFIRNIGLPAPPVIGRKISAPPTAPISSSVTISSSFAAVGTLPAIASSPTHRSSDAVSIASSTATPRHSVSSHTNTYVYYVWNLYICIKLPRLSIRRICLCVSLADSQKRADRFPLNFSWFTGFIRRRERI